MVGQNENAHLECGIDANPLEETMVSWKYEDKEIIRPTQRKFQDKKAYLTILDVNVTDAGSYFCFVDNGKGNPANASIFLIVKRKFIGVKSIYKSFRRIGKLLRVSHTAARSWIGNGIISMNSEQGI